MANEKERNISVSLSDDQLENVSGGGYYYPVSGCIKKEQITKLVWWFGSGVDYSKCKECQCPLLDELSTGSHCRQIAGQAIWE